MRCLMSCKSYDTSKIEIIRLALFVLATACHSILMDCISDLIEATSDRACPTV